MAAQPRPEFAERIAAWFAARVGRTVMIDAGTFADDRAPRVQSFLSYTTRLGDSFVSDEFVDPRVIVVNLSAKLDGSLLTVSPRRVVQAAFDDPDVGPDSLTIYFEDGGCISLMVVG